MTQCECGCGEDAGLYRKSGLRGKPRRFIPGHQNRGRSHGPKAPTTEYLGPNRRIMHGYIYVRTEPNGRWQREHRVIMERHLGRKLLPSENVHHRNEDTQDNRLENLEVMSHSDHNRLHHRKHSPDQDAPQ